MRSKTVIAAILVVVCSFPLIAQQQKMTPEQQKMMAAAEKAATPGANHKMLNSMVGTWDTVVKFFPAPGAPAMTSTGTSTNQWVLGGRYVEQRFKGTSMGQPFEGLGYTGYDNLKKQYFGTWMDTMSTGVMTSTGSATNGGKNWSFKASMDDPMTGKSMPVQEKITVVSNDKHVFEMWSPGPDGKSYKSMEITYTRKK